MKTFLLRTLPVAVLLLLPFGPDLGLGTDTDHRAWANPFQMLIVDQQTGQGISHARLISDNGLVCYTRADGSVLWTESTLMDRDVSFRIETAGAKRTVVVHVIPGGRTDVAMTH